MNLWMDGMSAPSHQEHLPEFLEALESSATPKFWRWQFTGLTVPGGGSTYFEYRHGKNPVVKYMV